MGKKDVGEELFKQFVKYYKEIEIPHLKAMHKIWSKFYREYKKLH